MKRINKKGAFAFDWFLIGVAIFALVFLTAVALVNDVDTQYGDIVNISDSELQEVNSRIDEQYSIAERAKNLTMDSDITDSDSLESMTRGSYSGVRTSAKSSLGLMTNITATVIKKLSLDGYFMQLFIVMLVILITFGLIYLLRGWRPN